MSKFTVVLAPQAESDISEAFRWYRERNTAAANAFRLEALEAIDSLGETAENWRVDEDGARRRVLRHFPYSIVFDVASTKVTVLAVAHHRRRPNYWRT